MTSNEREIAKARLKLLRPRARQPAREILRANVCGRSVDEEKKNFFRPRDFSPVDY